MRIKICHSKYGVLIDREVKKIEVIEQDEKLMIIATDWGNLEHNIVCDNMYTVLRIGDKSKAQKRLIDIGIDKGPTTWDLARDFDAAVQELEKNNVDTNKICFYLPDGEGWMKHYGPMPVEEARKICVEYWETVNSQNA